MSSTLVKNDDLNIKDENSFIFSVQNKKKFKVLNPSEAIHISSGYLIAFRFDGIGGNDFYIQENSGGINKKETYGDKNNETTNGNSSFTIDEFKVFELYF